MVPTWHGGTNEARHENQKKVCATLFMRYQKATKKDKKKILDEYTQTLGFNRDYLAHLLTNWGKIRYALSGGKSVKYIAKPTVKGQKKASRSKKTGRPEKYHKAFVDVLKAIWELFDFQCGKLLSPLLKGMNSFLIPEFNLNEELQTLLQSVSPATIDRKLKQEKQRYRLKGISTTKPGSLLKSQIPVRVCFDRDEKRPGFFEADTVSHCGARACGQFCQTLTLTDVGSGWTEERALLNNAHRWVKEQIALTRENLPFPMLGIDSDNGGEFINHQLLHWCVMSGVKFTRSRPYRKNDNCFVEQKNGDVVRKTVGYARFEGQNAFNALSEVYRYLNPLLNYFYPTLRLIAKDKLPSGRYKKIYEKDPKTPYQRLLESPHLSDECKEELRLRKTALNPVVLEHALDTARDRLLKLSVIESSIPSGKVS
jgi:hypothetical protein